VGVRFFAHVQTGPGAHPASCTMGTGSFLRLKRPGRGANHPPLLAPRLRMSRAIPLHLQPFLSQLGLLLFRIALKINELRSTSTGLASSTVPVTLILVRCDQLVRARHSHATTVHSDCKITVQFSHCFFPPLNRVISTNAYSEIAYNEGCLYYQLTASLN
jgi:hypothetical protein